MATEASVGAALGPWVLAAVDSEKMKDFALLLDDPNPIHLDAAAVRALGLGDRVINQGPAGLGYIIEMLRESLPGSRLRSIEVRFQANVFGGDRVTAAGKIAAIEHEADGLYARCELWLDADGGGDDSERAIEATALVRLPD